MVAYYIINVLYSFDWDSELEHKRCGFVYAIRLFSCNLVTRASLLPFFLSLEMKGSQET